MIQKYRQRTTKNTGREQHREEKWSRENCTHDWQHTTSYYSNIALISLCMSSLSLCMMCESFLLGDQQLSQSRQLLCRIYVQCAQHCFDIFHFTVSILVHVCQLSLPVSQVTFLCFSWSIPCLKLRGEDALELLLELWTKNDDFVKANIS